MSIRVARSICKNHSNKHLVYYQMHIKITCVIIQKYLRTGFRQSVVHNLHFQKDLLFF